jgi:hypothetical protein
MKKIVFFILPLLLLNMFVFADTNSTLTDLSYVSSFAVPFKSFNISQKTLRFDIVPLGEREYKDKVFGTVEEFIKIRDEHTQYTLPWLWRIFRDEVVPMGLTLTFFGLLFFPIVSVVKTNKNSISAKGRYRSRSVRRAKIVRHNVKTHSNGITKKKAKSAPSVQPLSVDKVTTVNRPEPLSVPRRKGKLFVFAAKKYEDRRPKFIEMLSSLPSFPEHGIDMNNLEIMYYSKYLSDNNRVVDDPFQMIHVHNKVPLSSGKFINVCFSPEDYCSCVDDGGMYLHVLRRFYLDVFHYNLKPQDLNRFSVRIFYD